MGAYPNAILDLQVQADGTIRDVVSGQLATITRTGEKYDFDPVTRQIITAPSNRLAAIKYPNGGGYWAAVEEPRTNLFLGSRFNADANADGLADQLLALGGIGANGTRIYSRTVGGAPSGFADSQRIQILNVIAGAGQTVGFYERLPITPNVAFTGSILARGSVSGCLAKIELYPRDSNGATIGAAANLTIPISDSWDRFSLSVTPIDGAVNVDVRFGVFNIGTGALADVEFALPQFEQGTTMTSIIPTATTTVSRSGEVVTFPSGSLNAAQGAIAVVARDPGATSGTRYTWGWRSTSTNRFLLYSANNTPHFGICSNSSTILYDNVGGAALGARVTGGRWSIGQTIRAFRNTVLGTRSDVMPSAPLNLPATFTIGSGGVGVGGELNVPLHRIVAFSSPLSDAEITSLSTALLAGVTSGRPMIVSPLAGALNGGLS